ncbi:MAG: SPFH domain-containing protein [Nitrosomonas sp.]|uniref:SPFH domain-containing protein n=1 Tax=Nitrosomonas sp. JL21 TaxID=153949 RepID=UPI0019617357|nr:SPFH domain-containing protein [Nitrosomonas sp. JL21]MBL8498908.1 SPFH domain-containing protein [Nitrosomonas sp.]MCC7091317.1 SPFH domain-containing protein [Nitrosomonas sp.]
MSQKRGSSAIGTTEHIISGANGWVLLMILLPAFLFAIFLIMTPGSPIKLIGGGFLLALALFCFKGFFTLEPNQAAVMIFFGKYAGSVCESGFFWVNPFYSRTRVSLRINNWNTPVLKVNDERGSPIEIAAVIAWRVQDTARAVFDVESTLNYLQIQSESAVRQVASSHAYDENEMIGAERKKSLRTDLDAIAELLRESIQQHVDVAGIIIEEAKIAHLAYAPEIANAMLRRQQAEAVVMARQKLVDGAVGMVEGALKNLEDKNIVSLTSDQRAVLVTNMMTVLLSETGAQPVIQMAQSTQ